MRKLVIASANPGKLREFRQMLEPLTYEIVPQTDLDISEAEEPHATFVENALAKARHASLHSGLPALADDSGICVAALGGEPGVHSARYAQSGAAGRETASREMQDERNNAKLLAALEDCADRRAHYYCVIVMMERPDDPQPLIAEGRWHGEVTAQRRGANGFGYDPYFFLPELNCTAAELEPVAKNRISHRGQALRRLVARLDVRHE